MIESDKKDKIKHRIHGEYANYIEYDYGRISLCFLNSWDELTITYTLPSKHLISDIDIAKVTKCNSFKELVYSCKQIKHRSYDIDDIIYKVGKYYNCNVCNNCTLLVNNLCG